jgi:Na+-driven multidrug efflux pump
MAVVSTVILMIPVMIFAPQAVWFFNKEPEVIEFGTLFIRWLSPFYVLSCANQIYAGALRGSGNTKAPMIIMLISFVGFRQVYLFIMKNFISNTILPISMSYPAGWLLCSTLMFIYFRKANLSKSRLVKD